MKHSILIFFLSLLPLTLIAEEGFTPLFNGETLTGWNGDKDTFRVEEKSIVAGSLKAKVPRNEFLCSAKEYDDFELRFSAKLDESKGGNNAGVQFRSQRIPNHHEMIGYQCDIGHYSDDRLIWGALYDESRRRKFLVEGDSAKLAKLVKRGGWNDLVVRCEGPRIRIWVNGLQTVDYTEKQKDIPLKGYIALQIHSGPPAEAWYKNIRIKQLPQK